MLSIFLKSIRDFLRPKILFISLLPIFGAALIWAGVFYLFYEQIHAALLQLLGHVPFIDSELLLNAIEWVGGAFIYYQLLILTSVMIVGLIADGVVDRVNARSYRLEKSGFGTLRGSVLISLRSNLVFVVLFVLTLPLIFVPLLNVLVQMLLWVVLIRTPLFYDSLAMYSTRDEYEALKGSERLVGFVVALAAASLFLIPLVGVFVYVLQLLFFTHFNLRRLAVIRRIVPSTPRV